MIGKGSRLTAQLLSLDLYKKLSFRERVFLGVGGAVLVSLIGYFLVVDPLLARIRTLDRLVLQKEEDLRVMETLKVRYENLQGKLKVIEEQIRRQPRDFSLLSFLEGAAQSVQIRKNISSMRPQAVVKQGEEFQEDSVEVRVENVSLPQIIEFLAAVEGSPHYLRLKQVRMKTRYSDPNAMDATFLISSYQYSGT